MILSFHVLTCNISLIDNIFTNKQETVTFSAVLLSHINDHQAVVIVTSQHNPRIRTKYITIYPNDDNSKKKFIKNFMQQNIYDSLNTDVSNDPNNNYNVLLDAITKSMNACLQIKMLNLTRKNIKKTHVSLLVS